MSDSANVPPASATNSEPSPSSPSPPPAAPRPPQPPRRIEGRSNSTLGCLFTVSVLLNIGAAVVIVLVCCVGFFRGWGVSTSADDLVLTEKHHSGTASAKDK